MDMEPNTLTETRWVKIMCDYRAEGIWDIEGVCLGPECLPIDQHLMDRIYAWQATFDALEEMILDQDGSSGDPVFDEAFEAIGEVGLHCARAVKRALPDWTVVYWDERLYRAHLRGSRLGPEPSFQYEITLQD